MKKLLLIAFALSAGYKSIAFPYSPIALSGFTADVVAEGSGSAANSTTHDVDGGNWNFVSRNFINPSNVGPTSGLPNNGLFTSAVTSSLQFQLAPYNSNNSLRITGTGTGTLTFNTPSPADQVFVLATSSGVSGVITTVNFTDGTSETFASQSVASWYDGANFAIRGLSRVHRGNNTIENPPNNPRIYQYMLTVSPANIYKPIQSISFNKTTTNGPLNVMGISVRTPPSTLSTDAGITAITAPNSGCALSGQETITVSVYNIGTATQSNIPVSYAINGGSPVTEIFPGPLAGNTAATYSFATKANLATIGTYSIAARTNLTGDLLASNDAITSTIVLSPPAASPTITASGPTTLCSGSSVKLTAASTSPGANYSWFINGNQIPGATFPTYTTSTAGSYTAVAISADCSSSPSAATVVTVNYAPSAPTLTAGGPTSFCNGGSVTLTAFTPNVGAAFIWFRNNNVIPGATSDTYIANSSGNYSVAADLSGCTSPTTASKAVSVTAQPATPTISQNGFILTSSQIAGNQWFKNGAAIPGATNQAYTTTSNGIYTVTVTNNGCSSATSNAVNITTTGLKEAQNLNVKVYPNPSNGEFTLTIPQGQVYEMAVTNLTGKVILQQTAKEANTQLNLNNAAKGIYLLKLVNNGNTGFRKLIVE